MLAYEKRFKDKLILIQGLGLNGGGLGTALFFVTKGFPVTITDLKTPEELKSTLDELAPYDRLITYRLGEHREEDFTRADIVVKGPGVPPSNTFIQAARQSGAEITSDIALFLEFSPARVYAVTGSKGKSSTVSCIYEIFKAHSSNSFLGGNITISPLTFLDRLNEESLVILELSSWQLRDLGHSPFAFAGTMITNILDDHQNYYSSIQDYIHDKVIIMQGQSDRGFTLVPREDKYLRPEHVITSAKVYTFGPADNNTTDIYYKEKTAVFKDRDTETELFDSALIKVPGRHGELNILAAGAFCYLAGIEVEAIRAGIGAFKGAPFRLQEVGSWQGITFINDTTATIPDAAYYALTSFSRPLIWIAGGNDKKLDFSVLQSVAHIPKKILLLTGAGTEKMKPVLGRADFSESSSLEHLFNQALAVARPGDIVLFSPGCTSFGLFANEFHRGRVFNELVARLVQGEGSG